MTDTKTTTSSDFAASVQETVANYFACWNAADDAERASAVEQTWAEDAMSIDPLADVSGRAEILEMLAAFPVMYPGHRFRQLGDIDVHHDVARWGWELLDPDQHRVLDGIDVAWVDDSGRLTRLAGFFGAQLPGTDA